MPTRKTHEKAFITLRPAISALFPHPPIIIPAVGRERLEGCLKTVEACRSLASRILSRRPERLFLVSPHTPRETKAFGLVDGSRLVGDFSRFGAPAERVDVPNDRTALEALLKRMRRSAPDLQIKRLSPQALDHGATVPLYFLAEAGWQGPTLIASLPWQHSPAQGARFGRLVGQVLYDLDQSVATVASGDMSHRCLRDAPAGFHPRAVEFDRELTALVAAGRLESIADIDPDLRELAAEDTSETVRIVSAAHDFHGDGAEVLSYEHPFGVGYLVAVLFDGAFRERPGSPEA